MRIMLPEFLSIGYLHQQGCENIQNYKESKMERFLMLMQELTNRSWYLFEDTHFEIYSKKLQRISPRDYVEYIRLLKANGLLNIKPYYMKGEECKKYSYAPVFSEKFFLHKIYRGKKKFINDYNNCINNNISGNKDKLIERLNELFSFLDFDVDGAMKFANKLKEDRKINPDINWFAKGRLQNLSGKWYKGVNPKPKNIEEQYKYELWQIDKWDGRYFDGHRDKTSFRFHSLLTRLPKEYKQFITFSGEKLYSIDIKNSQPFFSLIIMNPTFWYYPEMPNEEKIFIWRALMSQIPPWQLI